MKPDPVEEILRDIAAAKAELGGRRDQAVAEYEERLGALEALGGAVKDGSTEPRAAQARVRQILGERAGVGGWRAGRTRIGMSVPAGRGTAAAPVTPVGVRTGPSVHLASASLAKSLASLDERIVAVLAQARDPAERRAARLELSLLLQLRRSIDRQMGNVPNDVVLVESLVELSDHVQATLQDLGSGGPDRLRRLLDHDRALVSELVALGVQVADVKDRVQRGRALLGDGDSDLEAALAEAVAAFDHLQTELERRFPRQRGTLLDELLKLA